MEQKLWLYAVCAGEPVGDPGDDGGLADQGVQRHHRAAEVQRYGNGGTRHAAPASRRVASPCVKSSPLHTAQTSPPKGKLCFFLPAGFKNTSSQISASYSGDGRYVVCASEDSNVYVWRRATSPGGAAGGGVAVKAKTWRTSRAYECFFCKDVSAAVPWPLSPCLPPTRGGGGDDEERASSSVRGAVVGGDASASRSPVRHLGSLPLRPKSGPMTYSGEKQLGVPREPSSRWHGGAEGGNAWGMVVVTASLAGEIRVYQNFGMPLSLFRKT